MHEGEKWKWSRSVSDSERPHGLQPTRLFHPWDFPGKNTGVGCHCLLRETQCNPSQITKGIFHRIRTKNFTICMTQMVKNLLAIQVTRVWFLSWEDPLEKEMATHSSILAWRIPWTEEPGGLQSMGSQRIRHNWATNTHTHTHTQKRQRPWTAKAILRKKKQTYVYQGMRARRDKLGDWDWHIHITIYKIGN